MMRRSHQVTANVEKIADESVHGQESLRLTGRFEPSQVSLAVPCGLVWRLRRDCSRIGPCDGRRTAGPLGAQPCSCSACR